MTQYLITTFTDSTGITHNHVTQAKENQSFKVIEAESKEQAMVKFERINNNVALTFASNERKYKPGLTSIVKPPEPSWDWLEEEYKRLGIFNKDGD